jgi:uncharacterized membrane protein YhaH (DUF805 family)
VTFFEAVESVFKKYFQFSGRSLRSEFWYFALFIFIVDFLLLFLDAHILDISWSDFFYSEEAGYLGIIFGLATAIPYISVTARRLHDVNRSGWWMLITLTIIGIIPFLYWMCKESDNNENRYGEPPFSSGNQNDLLNTSIPNDVVENPENEGPWGKSLQNSKESETYSSEIENDLKKIDDLFEKSLITEEEKKNMRNKVLGLT